MTEANILLVDDEQANCLVFEQMIKEFIPECRLMVANSADAAWDIIRSTPIDCAVLDVVMPGVSGIELCRSLKEEPETNSFPVILITSLKMDPRLKQEGLEAGADDFLHRPVGGVELGAKIRVMLRVSRAEKKLRSLNARLISLIGDRSKALHESDERYRMVFQATSDPIVVFSITEDNQAGALLEVNSAATELLGYSHEELVGIQLSDIIPADRQAALPSRIESIRVHRELEFDITFLSRDGRQSELQVTARLLEFNDQRTVILVGRDVSETPAVKPSTFRHSGRFKLLAARTGQMVYELDVEDLHITLSGAVTQVTGYRQDEIADFQGGKWARLIHSDDRLRVQREFRTALDHVGKYLLQYRLQHKSGRYHFVEDQAVVIPGEDGRAARVIGTIKDISGRLKDEDNKRKQNLQLQHSQRLESLGVLAGGIAHDFNNILAGINGLTEMALQDLEPGTGIHEDLTQVLQAGHRARDLVRQILAFSRQSSEEKAVIRLDRILREVAKLIRATTQHDRNINIVEYVRDNTLPVECNAAQIHQVLMNICTNAAYSLKKCGGGTISLNIENAFVSPEMAKGYPHLRPGPHVKMTVHDTGHGMAPDIMPRIFDPFFTTKGPGEGTGLGLAVAHGNVTDHKGVILAESVQGKGATFEVFLPAASEDVIARAEESGKLAMRGLALVIAPEEVTARVLEKSLAKEGYQHRFYGSPRALFKDLQGSSHVDLVILDVNLPGSDGEEVAKEVRERFPGIPLILLSSFTDERTRQNPADSVANFVLAKPILPENLSRALQYVRLEDSTDSEG